MSTAPKIEWFCHLELKSNEVVRVHFFVKESCAGRAMESSRAAGKSRFRVKQYGLDLLCYKTDS